MSRGLGERQRNMLRLVCWADCPITLGKMPVAVAVSWEIDDDPYGTDRFEVSQARRDLDGINAAIEDAGDGNDDGLADRWYEAKHEFDRLLGAWLQERFYAVSDAKYRRRGYGEDTLRIRRIIEANYRAIRTLQDRGLVEVLAGTKVLEWSEKEWGIQRFVIRDWVFPTEDGIEEARRLGLL